MCGKATFEERLVDWEIIAETSIGAAHRDAKKPNQDCVGTPTPGTWKVLCVADGHGSGRHFRSDRGAKLAVDAASKVAVELERYARELASERSPTRERTSASAEADNNAARMEGSEDDGVNFYPQEPFTRLNALGDYAKHRFPRDIVRLWREAVDQDLDKNGVTDAERDAIRGEYGEGEMKRLQETPHLIYGTTLLFVGIADTFIVYAQIGDGDILTVSDDNKLERPIARDPALFANETTSLCTKEAERQIRVVIQTLADKPPALILAMTDGYSNSYRDDASFERVGRDFLERLRNKSGIDDVRGKLKAWLETISEQGSGDDISLALAYRVPLPC